MYNDQVIIKEKLDSDLLSRFGDAIANDVSLLIAKLAGKDTFVDNHLLLSLQNLLHLRKEEVAYFVKLALDLSTASAFAPVLLLEKIPTLFFYGVTAEIGTFLTNIKDYGARAVALFLGSEQLKTDDLIDILEHANIDFYKTLLEAVNARHSAFSVCCAMIMRSAAKIQSAISVDEIDAYLNVCREVLRLYGIKITEQYISQFHEFILYVPLADHLSVIATCANKSMVTAEFAVTYPKIYFTSNTIANDVNIGSSSSIDEIKAAKIAILKSKNYKVALESTLLLADSNFSAMILNWPNLSVPITSNILYQLQQDNYKQYILANPAVENELNSINRATNSNWLKSWTYCGKVMDLVFIREKILSLLQQNKFSLEPKSIIKNHNTLFNRSNPEYNSNRVIAMLDTLLTYCDNADTQNELAAMRDFITGDSKPLLALLSRSSLVIQTWERNPWTDYGQSDELYSCTGLGDYNAGNAPAFLADLNLNNLEIYSNGARVGRIHLCLVNDANNNPLLLLDCVDGTERMVVSKKKFDIIINAVLAYARSLGICQVKVNYDIDYNTTPKKFIAHMVNTLHDQKRIDFVSRFLDISTTRYLIPYPCQTFLESFIKNNGGFVRGALISI